MEVAAISIDLSATDLFPTSVAQVEITGLILWNYPT